MEISDSPPPKLFEEIGLSDGVRGENGGNGVVKIQIFFGDAIHVVDGHGANSIDVVVGRIAAFDRDGVDHAIARPETEFFCNSGADDFAAFGGFDQIGR